MPADPIHHDARNPYLFIVGCPRSGTTLLQRMLDHHPQLAVANDTHFIPRCLEKVAPEMLEVTIRGEDIPLTDALVEGVQAYHRFSRLGLSPTAVDEAARRSRSYGEFVAALYDEYGRLHGSVLAGEKTPDYVRHLPLLNGLFPQAKFIHIVRDGRDVALSLLNWANESKGPGRLELWKDEPLATCALWWHWQVSTGRRDAEHLASDQYLELSYEDVVAAPERVLHAVVDFLGLPFAQEMLEFHHAKQRSVGHLSAKSAWLPPTPGLRDWRTQMPADDVELFEALAGDLLQEYGYCPFSETVSEDVNRVADRCRSWWRAEMARRDAKHLRRRTVQPESQ